LHVLNIEHRVHSLKRLNKG